MVSSLNNPMQIKMKMTLAHSTEDFFVSAQPGKSLFASHGIEIRICFLMWFTSILLMARNIFMVLHMKIVYNQN